MAHEGRPGTIATLLATAAAALAATWWVPAWLANAFAHSRRPRPVADEQNALAPGRPGGEPPRSHRRAGGVVAAVTIAAVLAAIALITVIWRRIAHADS
jgi:hypothetical protein